MPIQARYSLSSNNIVRATPSLPIPIQYGKLSWSTSFEGFPQGTIEYDGIPENEISYFNGVYNFRSPDRKISVNLYGINFIVQRFSYEIQKINYGKNNTQVRIYKVTVNLKSELETKINQDIKVARIVTVGAKKISVHELASAAGIQYTGKTFYVKLPDNMDYDYTVNLQSSLQANARVLGCYISYSNGGISLIDINTSNGNWNLSSSEITTDGQNTLQNEVGYYDVSVTWGTNVPNTANNTANSNAYSLKEPVIETLYEGDENPDSPPDNTYVLKDLSSNSDISGPKKVLKKTQVVDGNPQTEEVWTYGFEYLAKDIQVGNTELLFSDSPSDFWEVISYERTQHIYDKIDGLTLNIQATDPLDPFRKIHLVLHPDYKEFASVSGLGSSLTFSSNTKYLTEVNTTGWQRFRFKKETDSGLETLQSDDPEYSLYFFKTLPTENITAYYLVTSRELYGENVGLPFRVEWKQYDQIEPRIQQYIDEYSQKTASGLIGLLYPDPTYVEPMVVLTETKAVNSFAYTPNPLSAPDNPLAPYTTGEESFYETDRKIVSSNRYRERTSESSFRNSGFLDCVEKITFKDVLGRPPEATTKKSNWEKNEQNSNNQNNTAIKYLMNSDNNSNIKRYGSKSYPEALTIYDAQRAAETELIIEGMGQDQVQKTVFSFYPSMRDGDIVSVENDLFSGLGQWRVMSVSWSLEFKGDASRYGLNPVCLSNATSVTLGLHRQRGVYITENYDSENYDRNNIAAGNTGDPKVQVSGGDGQHLGEILIKSSSRRSF